MQFVSFIYMTQVIGAGDAKCIYIQSSYNCENHTTKFL